MSSLRSRCPFLGLLIYLPLLLRISSRVNSDSLLILLNDIKLDLLLSLSLGIFEAGWRYLVNPLRRLRVLYFLLASPLRLHRGRCRLPRSFLGLLDLATALLSLNRLLLLGEFGLLLLGRWRIGMESLPTTRGHGFSGVNCFLELRL